MRGKIVDFNPFDVTSKELVWEDPSGWLEGFGVEPSGPVEIIDSDITTLSAAADKVIRVAGPQPFLVNIELQSYHDSQLARTLWYRQVALDYRHDLPVLTILVLLCKEANSPHLTGTYLRELPNGWQTNGYNYRVVRLWQEDPELYLTGALNLLPLAPLAAVSEPELAVVIARIRARVDPESPPLAAKLWTATYLLMGLRYNDELVANLLEGVQMTQSTTYQRILKEGRLREARHFLRRLGIRRFGEPDPSSAIALEGIQDVNRLEALGERALLTEVKSWQDLLEGA
jgi:predicted transposase YdaD